MSAPAKGPILVYEPNPVARLLVRLALGARAARFVTGPEEALAAVESVKPSAIIVADAASEAIEVIFARAEGTRVLVLARQSTPEDWSFCGATTLPLPASREVLARTLAAWLSPPSPSRTIRRPAVV